MLTFQANHNSNSNSLSANAVVGDTANVRVFKQITTANSTQVGAILLLAILQMYEFSSKSQHSNYNIVYNIVVGDTANVRVFKQITTIPYSHLWHQ